MLSLKRVGLLLVVLAGTGALDSPFVSLKCYKNDLEDLDDRMPLNLGNLIALVEKWETKDMGSYFFVPDRIAAALVKSYRLDGTIYTTSDTSINWPRSERAEVEKQSIMDALLTTDELTPENVFEPREECSLYFMLSHSTDIYPHPGLNYVWLNTYPRRRRSDDLSSLNAAPRYVLPDDRNPAEHPIENGIIWTPSGPIAAGTLLAGIMATPMNDETTLLEIYGDKHTDYMPDEMRSKRLHPQHVSTLAGDIGQSAILAAVLPTSGNRLYLGPVGRFANSTASPKLFTLESSSDGIVSYLTRSEIFAGIDALLIQKVLKESSSTIKLSQVLRMYYSDHGLPNYPDYRACNRMQNFKDLDIQKIKEQALNFMYAYTHKFSEISDLVRQHKEDYSAIESMYKGALDSVWSSLQSFVEGYRYDDYDECPIETKYDFKCENNVDLLVVFGHEGGSTEIDKELRYITHLAQMIDVGEKRSRLGILDGKSAKWLFQMTNFSNVADWGSNFTTSPPSTVYISGSDMPAVLKELNNTYTNYYNELLNDTNSAEAHAQIVLWNVPSRMPDDDKEFKKELEDFKRLFPDVYFLLVGKSSSNFNDLIVDKNTDFFLNTQNDMESFAATLAQRICKVPSAFVYPECSDDNKQESYHRYTGYVSPNFTTSIKISPRYYRYSERVKLKVDSSNVEVCTKRNTSDEANCTKTSELEWIHLCGRWLEECNPIYLNVTGKPGIGTVCSQGDECQYPNQVKFEITHEGMTCGTQSVASSIIMLALTGFIYKLI